MSMNGTTVMKYSDESEIKRELGIRSWGNLPKGKMIKFVAMMPDIDPDVALKIVEQFPEFKEFAMDGVDAMKKAHDSTLTANTQSQDQVYQALQEIREVLKGELDRDGLTEEQRRYLVEQTMETGRMAFQKDTESKQYLDGLLNKVLVGVGAALVLGVAFVGGKLMGEIKDGPEDSHEA
jgi:hypothetical protein